MTVPFERIDLAGKGELRVVADAEALAQAAAALFAEITGAAVQASGMATVALSGGSTPRRMGQLLAAEPYAASVPWGNLEIFWGDERFVPLSSEESNAGVAMRTFLDTVAVDPLRVHAWDTSDTTPGASADAYDALVRERVPGPNGGFPRFDLVLLGMGDDGHTASLFPGTTALGERTRVAVANPVEKLNTTRLTLTAPVINAARTVVFLMAGAGKASRLAEVIDGPRETDRLPSQLIAPDNGRLIWLVDRAAATEVLARRG
jgi:6-phosphogluconolactonase